MSKKFKVTPDPTELILNQPFDEGFENQISDPEQKTPLLPIEGFPEFIQHFITGMAEVYRTPRDYWAGAVIMATSLAIGDKFELVTKYTNNPIFWGVFVGDVSNGKTEPLSKCLSFFQNLDAEKYKEYKISLAEFERIRRMTKEEMEDDGINIRPTKPQSFQYILIDSTPEALAEAHDANKRGIMFYRDELKGWIDDFGRYAKSGEQSNMLSMWSQQCVTYNRVSKPIILIEKPCVFVAGGVHRELLHTLASDNRAENGFLARMITFFPDNTEKQKYNNGTPNNELLKAWNGFLENMIKIENPKTLTLPERTSKLYENWYNDNVNRINAESTPYLKGVYGKLDIICLRLAIVIRGMNYQLEGTTTPEILPSEMEAAIQLTEYFRITALKVYHQIYGGKERINMNYKEVANFLQKEVGLNKSQAGEVLKKKRQQIQRWTKNK